MKRAIATALAFLCAAYASYGWHCSALNRDYAFPYDGSGEFPIGESDKVTMSSKEAMVSLGSGLEWVTNVALFAHGNEPVCATKLRTHDFTTSLLPKAYMDWMYEQTRGIFTRDWHATYSDGHGTNTVEILGLHYGNPWDIEYEVLAPPEPPSGDIRLCDIRHHFYSEVFDFTKQPGWGRLVTAYSNSFERILGYPPSLYENNGNNYLPFDDIIGYYTFANLWNILQPMPYYPPNLKYLVSESFPTAFVTPVFTDLCLSYKFGGASPFLVETLKSRYTTFSNYNVSITTNADYTATMRLTFTGYGTTEYTNLEYTVSRVAFGQTAVASSEAFGYPYSIPASSPAKVVVDDSATPVFHDNFPYYDPVSGEVVDLAGRCYPLYYAWASNVIGSVSLPYQFDYTLSRILADYPYDRTTYPPRLAGDGNYADAACVYKATADGMDYDQGYYFYDDEITSGSGLPGWEQTPTNDAMKSACLVAMGITNTISYVNDMTWMTVLPSIKYKNANTTTTIPPNPATDEFGHRLFAVYDETGNRGYIGYTNTNDWNFVQGVLQNPPPMTVNPIPPYEEANGRPIYDELHGNYEWSLELRVDFDSYGYWYFNNWLR